MKDGWVGFFCSSVGRGDRHQGFPHDDARDAVRGDDDDEDDNHDDDDDDDYDDDNDDFTILTRFNSKAGRPAPGFPSR